MATVVLVIGVILHTVSKSSAEYQAEAGAELPADEVEVEVPMLGVQHMQACMIS